MRDILDIRLDINKIDKEFQDLFIKRMNLVQEVATYKKANNKPIFDKDREEEMVEKAVSEFKDEELREYFLEFLKSSIEISKKYQKELLNIEEEVLPIGFQGIEGSYSHKALTQKFPDRDSFSFKNFEDVFRGVKEKKISCGILPFENSSTGDITDNLDLLRKHNLYISDLIEVKVDHCLLGVPGSKISDLRDIYSHLQGFKQSKKFLKGHSFREIPYFNTAISAKLVSKKNDKTIGAIASKEAAKIYNLDILVPSINTQEDNTTKFIVVTRKIHPALKHNRVLITFSTFNTPGSLSTILGEFSKQGLNLSSIRSRPLKDVQWEYLFFAELEGHYSTIVPSLEKIKDKCKELKVVGSYES